MEKVEFGKDVLAQMFSEARSYNGFQKKDIPDVVLTKLYDLVKYGPTAANTCPARFVFVRSKDGKEKLMKAIPESNAVKTSEAACSVIVAYDMKFYERLDKLFPHDNARSWFEGNDDSIKYNSLMNGSLQAGYFIMAARALGLDCGPIGGFDKDMVDKLFMDNTSWKTNFIINLGYGRDDSLFPRSPRLDFEEACVLA